MMEDNFTPELIEKARQAKFVEELIALAKENSMTLTQDEAEDYFAQLQESCNKSGELSDEELDSVAGGGCGEVNFPKREFRIVGKYDTCEKFVCARCGGKGENGMHGCFGSPNLYMDYCPYCGHSISDGGGVYRCTL